MPATLLAVDDSVTMRKVLEMTFAGEDFRVVSADSADAALAMIKSESPALVMADCTLPDKTGYDLCKAIKRDTPGILVLLLSSKLNPYDKGKGEAAKADGYIDKPFETQKLIDKVRKLLSDAKKPTQKPSTAAKPYRAPVSSGATLLGQGAPPTRSRTQKSPPNAAPGQPSNLRSTADFATRPQGSSAPTTTATSASKAVPAKPAPPFSAKPTTTKTGVTRSVEASTIPGQPRAPFSARPPTDENQTVGGASGDQVFESKLSDLGLNKQQIEGVLALSNEVIERVVWEVVPVLAETIIKEELKRLTEE